MWLVQDHCLLTNVQAKAKVASFRSNQARFLMQMETCSIWEIVTLDLQEHQTQANL